MSEVKLNLVDAERVLHGTIHGSITDACVAALSAEPETIAELEAALTRYIEPRDSLTYFTSFHSIDYPTNSSPPSAGLETVGSHRLELDTEPWDAGIVVIDLAARIVANESSYSQPGPEGEVFYHDGQTLTDVPVLYRLPDDWLFVNSVDAYRWSREGRLRERAGNPLVNDRPILFGRPLLEFIVNAYLSLPGQTWSPRTSPAQLTTPDDNAMQEEALAKEISTIHARWLLTPREDLRGHSPRDVLLAHQDFIDFDLHTRSLQWSLRNEGPPCLSETSCAYRFAGFGTHECVLYYDLVRHLICSLVELRTTALLEHDELGCGAAAGSDLTKDSPAPNDLIFNPACGSEQIDQLIAKLEQIKTDWLENPHSDLDGRIPAIIIENERKRLPQAIRPRDMIVDDDCPMCQMFGDETTPLGMGVGFWHLDGSHMDDDFAFSFYKTRQEWEVENRRREEFDREFQMEWTERQRRISRGEAAEPDPFFKPERLGSGWGWFDPLYYADTPELDPTGTGDAPRSDFDDSNESEFH